MTGIRVSRTDAGERRDNLPSQLTPFVDRDRELAELSRIVQEQRLCSLVGPAGIGKTRLALQLAERLRRHFRDGVWFVELAAVADGQLLPSAIVSALELTEDGQASPLAVIEAALATRHMVLVLDNCEHLVDHAAPLVARLLRVCAALTVLATTRVRLGVPGELVWRVPALGLPSQEQTYGAQELLKVSAISLFLDRSQRRNPNFFINPANAGAVAELMRRLEGLPLAIELAAGWTGTLSPAELLDRLASRFQLLVSHERVVSPRHSSLLAAIDSSYAALEPGEKSVFRQLGVFPGGWSISSMTAVCELERPAAVHLLNRLVDHSLVAVLTATVGPTRYRLAEALRDYALEHLKASGEYDAAQQRFTEHFVNVAESAMAAIAGPQGPGWLDLLDAEYSNLRAVFEMDVAANPELRLRLATALVPYWHFRGLFSEARLHLTNAVAATEPTSPTLVSALNGLSRLCWAQGDLANASHSGRQAFRGARESGDRAGCALALLRLAQASLDAGHRRHARGWTERARRIATELRDERLAAASLLQLGQVALVEGRLDEAASLVLQSIELFRQTKRVDQEAMASLVLGRVRLQQDRHEEAEAALLGSLTLLRPFALPRHSVPMLESLAAVAAAQGDDLRAARLAGAASALLDRIGARPPATAPMRTAIVARWQASLSARGADRAWREGRAMGLGEANAYALGDDSSGPTAPSIQQEVPLALTRRQLEVARLVAEGLTNKEIASRLFISERTAEGHVDQICNKLGFNSRVQIAAWLIRGEQSERE
ncbi:MAG TPA: LuxR C-terminal-related transcriptional regulator [Candidatus Dormibacteraeota bacterium]|nr:LuxR C-terminal-related transcriptional regulator [Candidatus Dormibacteraeota bacterium]